MRKSPLYKNKYRIDSNRKKGYDYSSSGFYFITIDVKNLKEYLGKVENNKMRVSQLGIIAEECWRAIPNHFSNIKLDEFVVMPDHMHGVIEIRAGRGAINRICTNGGFARENNPMGQGTIGEIIRWYKGKCTFEIRKISKDFKWQSNYYDSIIHSVEDLERIRVYIKNNPSNYRK